MKNKIKISVCIISLTILIMISIFSTFFSNVWSLLTQNGYFLPEESNIFIFKTTQISEGSGEMWLYGEDCKFYYGLNIEPNYSPLYFILRKGKEPKAFDKFNYKTWTYDKNDE